MANESGGAVKADISTDRQTGRSRGFGTVLFETEEAAQAAIAVRCRGSIPYHHTSRSCQLPHCAVWRRGGPSAAIEVVDQDWGFVRQCVKQAAHALAAMLSPQLCFGCRRSPAARSTAGTSPQSWTSTPPRTSGFPSDVTCQPCQTALVECWTASAILQDSMTWSQRRARHYSGVAMRCGQQSRPIWKLYVLNSLCLGRTGSNWQSQLSTPHGVQRFWSLLLRVTHLNDWQGSWQYEDLHQSWIPRFLLTCQWTS